MHLEKKFIIIVAVIAICLTGCGKGGKQMTERTEVSYTVVPRDELPEELKRVIDEKKKEPLTMSLGLGEYLYIVEGYGTMPTGGYSISIEYVEQNDEEIFFKSKIIGPKTSEPVNMVKTYPYIVVKTEYTDKKIVFE